MNQLNNKPRLTAFLSLCWVLSNTGCDRSWRDENFAPPESTVGEEVVPPRVRPNVPTTVNPTTTTLPLQPGQPQLNDAGVPVEGPDPVLDFDASVEPTTPGGNETDENQTDEVVTGDEETKAPTPAETDEPEPGETDVPNTEGGDLTAAPAASTNSEATTEPDDVEPPDEPEPFTKLSLLKAASQCAVHEYDAFAQAAHALDAAVGAIGDDATLAVAQQAFITAMLTFQRVEVFRIGPAARAMDPGGQDLRDWIYSFPTQNRCQVDRNIVSEVYATNFSGVLFNARGLLALEYLLFERGTTNLCSAGIDINIKGTWAGLSQSQLNSRRDAYAKVLADDIADRADQLVDAWDDDGGNFMAEVVNAGDGSGTFSTQQAALNAFSHALFYVELELKDFKLGLPLGMNADCIPSAAKGCAHLAELPYSGLSGPSIAQNLTAFRLLFEGCGENYEGVGFDDWLREADQGELADRMITNLAAAQQEVAALPRLLEDAFYDAPTEARAVHTAVKGVTDLLKTEFVSVLNLELPMTAEGDND
jgi:predicted lipoprotein